MDRSRRITRITVWVAAGVSLLALALRDLQLDRTIVASADVRRNRATAYLSALGPPARVALSSHSATLHAEPVYVDFRIPRWFRRATVELVMDNPHALPFRVGIRTHPTVWTFHFPEVGAELRIPFTLDRTWQVERNAYQFILAAPGVTPERPIIIRSLRVIAERDPMCIGRLCV